MTPIVTLMDSPFWFQFPNAEKRPCMDLWLSLNDERLKETQMFLDQLGWSRCAFRCLPFNFCCSPKNGGGRNWQKTNSSLFGAQWIYDVYMIRIIIHIWTGYIHIPQTCYIQMSYTSPSGSSQWAAVITRCLCCSKVHLARQHRHRNSNAWHSPSATGTRNMPEHHDPTTARRRNYNTSHNTMINNMINKNKLIYSCGRRISSSSIFVFVLLFVLCSVACCCCCCCCCWWWWWWNKCAHMSIR